MASRAIDSFNRANQELTQAETGQPWVWHRGRGDVRNSRAVVSGNGILTVNTGVGGGNVEASIDIIPNDGGGQALYFRVVDVNRWWRFYKAQFINTYSYQSGTTEPTYGYVGNGTYYYTPSGDWVYLGTYEVPPGNPSRGRTDTEYSNYDARVGTYLYRRDYYTFPNAARQNGFQTNYNEYQVRSVYENQSYQVIAPGQPIYSTATETVTEVRLDKCVNGQVTNVKSVGVSSGITKLGVHLSEERITCLVDGSPVWGVVQDSTHQTAPLHGIGQSEVNENNNTAGIENFTATPFVISGYVPYVML